MGLRDRTARSCGGELLSDQMTARLLRAFGMDSAEAEELSARPLPEVPELAVDGGHR